MSSKHPYAAQLIKQGLYDNLQSFPELEKRISALGEQNTKIVGDAFEIFVEGYLATQQKLQADTLWLVGQLPLEVRQQLNLPNDAKGIDGVFRTRIDTLVPYQVKFRSRRAYLTFSEVAPFLGLTERATDRIIFTNSFEVAEDAKNRDAMRTVRGIDFDDLTVDELRAISGWLRQQPIPITKLTPYPYQIRALADIAETVTRSDRAHIVMACGTGKTLVALWAVERLKPKTILVLVPSLTLLQQTLDEWSRHNNWGKDFTYLCVCSDPTVALKDEYDPFNWKGWIWSFALIPTPMRFGGSSNRTTRTSRSFFRLITHRLSCRRAYVVWHRWMSPSSMRPTRLQDRKVVLLRMRSFKKTLLSENDCSSRRHHVITTSGTAIARATSRSNQWAILLYTVHAPIP